jgi:hypothetical protein
MKHLSEKEIVEHYFSDAGSRASRVASRHLDECAECAAERARVADDMSAMQGMDFIELRADYGESVWSRVSAALPERVIEKSPVRRLTWGRGWRLGWGWGLGYVAASAVLVLGAFQIGRVWEQRQHSVATAAKAPTPAPMERRVVVVVLGDHLDRSERLLVELKHADGEDVDVVKPLREEALNLLAANREFQEDADKGDDTALKEALDHLDHLLTDVANDPGGLNAASIARLQRQMKADGLLFEVRVLRSRSPHRDATIQIAAKGGTA